MHGRGCVAGGMHGGGMHARWHAWQGVCMAGGMHGGGHAWQGACMVGDFHGGGGGLCDREHAWQGYHVWQGGMHGRGHVWQGGCMAGEMATAADGTHPTGMHSCSTCI